MRKAFNFYRSYYDVAQELNDKDRLAFYDALLKRQFTGIEIELIGMSKFAYLSQKHSIDQQIKGYMDKTKDPLVDPSVGGMQGGSVDPSVQEKEKEKEKEKVEYTMDFRKNNFAQSLQPYIETYGREMLNEFYMYWTEPNQRKTKMKYEMEKTWSIERRLNTWSKQSVKFGTAVSKAEKPKFDPYG